MDKGQPLQEISRLEKQGEQASGNACPDHYSTVIWWKKLKPMSRLQVYCRQNIRKKINFLGHLTVAKLIEILFFFKLNFKLKTVPKLLFFSCYTTKQTYLWAKQRNMELTFSIQYRITSHLVLRKQNLLFYPQLEYTMTVVTYLQLWYVWQDKEPAPLEICLAYIL